jgi:Fibronectin type III domain
MSVPSAPTGLLNVPSNTTGTQIGLSWTAPTQTGGTPILDYKVYYDQGSS